MEKTAELEMYFEDVLRPTCYSTEAEEELEYENLYAIPVAA